MDDHVESKGKYYVALSDIHGNGTFAVDDIKAGEIVGYMRVGGKRTILGRTANHSIEPNTYAKRLENGEALMIALFVIPFGDELTLNFRQVLSVNKELRR